MGKGGPPEKEASRAAPAGAKPQADGGPDGDDKLAEDRADGAQGKPKSLWPFTLKTAAATVGGGVLTLCVTVAQVSYTKYLEVLDRQGEQGIGLQQDLFQKTGRIENEIIKVYNVLDHDPARAPAPDLTASLTVLNEQWRLDRLWFRIRGAQIYGNGVGDRIYDPREESIELANCGLEVVGEPHRTDPDCPARQHEEALRLRREVARLKGERAAGREVQLTPRSFQTNFRLTRKVLGAYLACWGRGLDGQIVQRRACPNPRDIVDIMGRRIDLMAMAREALSTEIMRRSALRD